MKHLTTVLLTLLVLGGCFNERDRCINANTYEDNFLSKRQAFAADLKDDDDVSELTEVFVESLNPREKKYQKCMIDEHYRQPELTWEEVYEICKKRIATNQAEEAIKVCNEQGIY